MSTNMHLPYASKAYNFEFMLLYNIKQIVQIVDDETTHLTGIAMNKIKILNCPESKLAILCKHGIVTQVGTYNECNNADLPLCMVDKVDCKGGCVLPGFVDGHSHPVFAGDRVHEFAMKLAGATYMEVQSAGGGIHFTTQKTREASEISLIQDFLLIAKEMLKSGTTLLEAKSGYGLNMETEIKMLRVLNVASKSTPLEVSATFCGAHAIPSGSTEEKQTQLIVDEIIPELKRIKQMNNDLETLENIDVFCEKNVFEIESSRKILMAGKKAGLRINFHADELSQLGGAELAAEIKGAAVSHLEEISEQGIHDLSKSGTVAVLLPTTAYVLRLKPPPARKMIDAGVCVALGSDFNPNAYCYSMPMVMNFACVLFKMSMSEALVAATLNAAYSLNRGKTHGAIGVGRIADFVVLDTPNWEHLIYRMGCHQNLISHVIKAGKVVYAKT
ncbi:amidohydrolase family domain-containing protein [Ditylenchus destructor]|nr:amidohydrolase family domain-containing protein [Ditylenchus destructor]